MQGDSHQHPADHSRQVHIAFREIIYVQQETPQKCASSQICETKFGGAHVSVHVTEEDTHKGGSHPQD